MPLYEYICQDCCQRFELLRPMKDADAPAACLNCKSEHIVRQLALFNAHSAGSSTGSSVIAGNSGGGCGSCSGGSCGSCGR